MLILLVRLGLRVSEVAAMELDDIDWRSGQVTIRGKGSRIGQLPLPADAGQAIAAWLRGARPGCSCRQVFTTLLAPLGPLTRKSVAAIVKRAARRAGLEAVTAHRLRHGAATSCAGASLHEVGQVLRHASMLNTARYARVDHAALSAVARPWPGAARSRRRPRRSPATFDQRKNAGAPSTHRISSPWSALERPSSTENSLNDPTRRPNPRLPKRS